jgi:SnoaL-like domain
MESEVLDRAEIRDLIESWAVWRDAGMWDRLRTVWHDDGRMMATWFQGTADEFIAASQGSFARGVRSQHMLGGSTIEISGMRALAQTKMAILHRAPVEGVVCDFTCIGRFYDFFDKRIPTLPRLPGRDSEEGRWGLVLRQPIYEKDRIDPVEPGARPKLDADLLARFPEGYRHLAYLQTRHGYTVKPDMPGLVGPELDALYARGAAWLRGETV